MKLFKTNADIKTDYRPENINHAFEKCIKYKSNGEKIHQSSNILKKLDHIWVIQPQNTLIVCHLYQKTEMKDN